MDGLECSEVSMRSINLGDRIDSEYFTHNYLHMEAVLSSTKTVELRQLGHLVASAFYPAATHLYDIGELPFIRCVDSVSYPAITHLQDNNFERIPEDFIRNNKGVNKLRKNDIVITKVGTPCFSSIVKDYEEVALSRTVLGVTNIQGILPEYLLVFLRSKYGFSQLYRVRELTIQYQLTLDRVGRVKIFTPSNDFQKIIQAYFEDYLHLIRDSIYQYRQADEILLSSLNLENFTPSTENTSIKSFSQVDQSGRLDAEYYHPKFDELLQRLHTHAEKIIRVRDIRIENHRGVQPDYIENGEIAVVNSKNILENGLDYDGFSSTSLTLWKLKPEAHIEQNDILIYTTGANVGRAAMYRIDAPALASNHVNILRVNHGHPQYIAFVINSMIGRLQTERLSTGSAQQELYPKDIDSFIIPLVPEGTQTEIESLLDKSYALREQSKSLLKAATRAVEIAIEQDESAAIAYLREHTEGDA